MKTCSTCKESKDESMFHKRLGRKSGIQSCCKECNKLAAKRWYASHQDVANKRSKKWNAAHSDKYAAASIKWKQNHPDKVKARVRKWKIEHPELAKARSRKYRHMRRAKLANSPFPLEFKLMPHCWICLSTENLSVDHIIPVTRGGTNDISNLTTLCKSCNSSKGNKTYTEWFEKRLQQARSSQ